jgi:hypothetical protein
MADNSQSVDSPVLSEPTAPKLSTQQDEKVNSGLKILGYAFIFVSAISFVLAFVPNSLWLPYVPIIVGIFAFCFGYILVFKGAPRAGMIPAEDKDLFTNSILDKPQTIERYITLRSLSGIPGFFRNLGIIGLPLATISITILFCLLAIACYAVNAATGKDVIPTTFSQSILELSKLTLGAFIGSFVGKVQRTPGIDDIGSSTVTSNSRQSADKSENESSDQNSSNNSASEK